MFPECPHSGALISKGLTPGDGQVIINSASDCDTSCQKVLASLNEVQDSRPLNHHCSIVSGEQTSMSQARPDP